jgi:hypothetical protein
LFKADSETHDARNTLELFEVPAFIPSNIRLKPQLQRKRDFKNENCKEYQKLSKEFREFNETYIQPAKAIMLKDKRLVLVQSQENSKQKLLQQLLRITQAVCNSRVEPSVTLAMLRINDPIDDRTVRTRETTEENKTATIGFAFLLLFVINSSKVLQAYMGEKTQLSMLGKASKFLKVPKPVLDMNKNDSNYKPIDKSACIRIGNLTFEKPNEKVWTNAMSIANSLVNTVIHITLEQRQSYVLQQNRSKALQAVRACGIRQGHISSATTVKSMIENSTMEDSAVLSETNSRRKKLHNNLMTYCNNKLRRITEKITNKVLPKKKSINIDNDTTPNAAVGTATVTFDTNINTPPPTTTTDQNANKRKSSEKNENNRKKQKLAKENAAKATATAKLKLKEAKALLATAARATADATTSPNKKNKKENSNNNNNNKNKNRNATTTTAAVPKN